MIKRNLTPVFKTYNMGQISLIPRDIEEEIPQNHMVRRVNEAVEQIEMKAVYERYKGGGTSSYHPKMMLKVLIYAYSEQIYSSRKIAKALRENIYFMWLSGNNHPDFHTINRFRGEILKETIGSIFGSVIKLLVEGGYVKLENYFVDGTKIEANANKYTYVWAKNTNRYKKAIEDQVKGLLNHIDEINKAEDEEYGEFDLPEMGENAHIDSEKLERTIKELNEKLKKISEENSREEKKPEKAKKEKPDDDRQPRLFKKELSKTIKELSKNQLPKLKKYEEQTMKLKGRNSYSKTDPDATFMRMKEDHMQNGQLKAGYNIQIGTEKRFVLGYSVHQRPGDPGCFIPHMHETQVQRHGLQPKNVIADSAYGSEENYQYLESKQIQAYVKYGQFQKEAGKLHPVLNSFAIEQMPYNEIEDTFTCPNGEKLFYKETIHRRSDNNFENTLRIYRCASCGQCALKSHCTKASGNREAQVNFRLWKLKARARDLLLSEQGIQLQKQRSIDVETVFGRIKQNWGMRRFHLRGLEKVKIEWGILCMAHNISNITNLAIK